MKEYKNRKGEDRVMPVMGVDITPSEAMDDDLGWCLGCGDLCEGVEPDARKYTCEVCDKPLVYGLAELALMGLIATDPEGD